jgi:hypothetical protein
LLPLARERLSPRTTPTTAKLYYTDAEWEAFARGVKDGESTSTSRGNLP